MQLININKSYFYSKTLRRAIEKHLQRFDYINYEQVIREIRKAKYKHEFQDSKIKCSFSYEDAIAIEESLKDNISFKRALRQTYNKKNQKHRVNNRIKSMLFTMYNSLYNTTDKYYAYFTTLTFKPEVLDNTNKQTRRTYIARFLKEFTFYYIANLDKGSLHEREHYHAIVLLTKEQNEQLTLHKGRHYYHNNYNYGYSDFEFVVVPELLFLEGEAKYKIDELIKNDSSSCKMSTYINKLTNHAYKENTGDKLIFARNKGDFLVKNYYNKIENNNNRIVEHLKSEFGDIEVI